MIRLSDAGDRTRLRWAFGLAFGLFALVAAPLAAQDANAEEEEEALNPAITTEAYLSPPDEVLSAVLAPRHEWVNLNNLGPSGEWFLRDVSDGFPSLAIFAKEAYDLAQFQVDPMANRDRRLTTRGLAGYQFISVDGQRSVDVDIPAGARVSGGTWSPDGSQIAFMAHFEDATHIYVADAGSSASRRITDTPLLATWVTGLDWTGDGSSVVTVLLPEGRGAEPAEPAVPETPKVRVTTDGENKLRTYFDLLQTPHERRLVEYFSTGQLAKIDVSSGDATLVGEPAMIRSVDVSPDGEYFRVTTIEGPFSYIVPVGNSATTEAIWDLDGEVLAVIQERELRDGIQTGNGGGFGFGNGPVGDDKRALTWRHDGPGMAYLQLEARPERDEEAEEEQEEEAEEREPRMDQVMYWLPPFSDESSEVVYATEDRINAFAFDESAGTLFLTRRSNGSETVSAVMLDDPSEEHTIYEEDTDDFTADQGSLMRTRSDNGAFVVRTSSDGSSVYLQGIQRFEEFMDNAPRPFIDRVAIESGEKERVFQSSDEMYETVSAVLDDNVSQLVIRRESPTSPPNSYRMDLGSGASEALTMNQDLTPEITAARREVVMVTRPDGIESRVEVTFPANYVEGTETPAMFWFYPREYTEQEDYDETLTGFNKNRFPSVAPRSMEILTLLGYVVVEPDLPIIGESGQMNNNYIHDLRQTLGAVIDTLANREWIDRDRLAIGGHSYGAFGTANAMMNTSYFKAGIAGDGNYNRTLTPVGFQSERRELWEAEQLYVEMSPFFKADHLTGALLMYHGEDDHNVGTHPMHSRRLFHALNSLGKTAAMYMYPFEDHGPATRETTLDLWARWTAWLETYIGDPRQDTRSVTFEEDTSN